MAEPARMQNPTVTHEVESFERSAIIGFERLVCSCGWKTLLGRKTTILGLYELHAKGLNPVVHLK